VRARFVFAAIAITGTASADEAWVRARAPHVEVLTNGSAADAQRAAARVETFHRVLQAALLPLPAPAGPPPLVLAFRDTASFKRFLPLRNGEPQEVDGVILGGSDRPYIAVNLGSADFERALAHEYVHFALNPVLPAQPPWMGEGLAELLATASVWPQSATLGRASDAHLRSMSGEERMPLRAVLEVGYLSPTYQGGAGAGGRRALFYARSWALVHWIVVGGHGGMPAIAAFARAIAEGDEPEAAFARSFGMTVDAAEASLAAHLETLPLPALAIPLPPAGVPAPGEVSTVNSAEVDRHLGELLLRGGRAADARPYFERALEGGDLSAHHALAGLLLQEGRLAEARRHVEAALAADPDDGRALHRRAQHLVREVAHRGDVLGDAETARAAAVLERALAADPDLADAADLLARLRPQPLALRIAQMRRVVNRQPERADLAFTLAHLHVKRNDFAEAARVLRRARAATRDETHRFLSDHMLGKIGAYVSGQGEARGILEAVECLPGGALAFRVRTPKGLLRLAADSPRELFLYDADGGTVERSLTCGPASLAVTARYVSGPPGAETHRILSLSFDDGGR
jgi:tetratricopeptide (TPR) repeat protein